MSGYGSDVLEGEVEGRVPGEGGGRAPVEDLGHGPGGEASGPAFSVGLYKWPIRLRNGVVGGEGRGVGENTRTIFEESITELKTNV